MAYFQTAWGSHMPISNRDFVVQDLLDFFRSRCTNASLIKDESSNVKHLCGYDFNLAGWRLLADTISFQPHIHAFGYGLRATERVGPGRPKIACIFWFHSPR
jgi:hypothetical protein